MTTDFVTEWFKNCPNCGCKQKYSTKSGLNLAAKQNTLCYSCSKTGEKNAQYNKIGTNFGKKFSKNHKKRISESRLGEKHWFYNQHLSDSHKEKQSKSLKKFYLKNPIAKLQKQNIQIERYNYVNEKKKTSVLTKQAMHRPEIRKKHLEGLHHSKWIKVRTDKGQLELLDKWNKLGFNFEPNYKIKTDLDLFYIYIDGYDKEKNVVLEYDSKYHLRKTQKEKDLIRQKKIISVLKPNRFWRFDAVNKIAKNILETGINQ